MSFGVHKARTKMVLPQRQHKFSVSSYGSGVSSVFEDPRASNPQLTQTIGRNANQPNSHVLRYGTTRSMPGDHHHHQNGKVITNGSATTGRRMYSANTTRRRPTTHRTFSTVKGMFKRSAIPENKEDAFSSFEIEMNKSPFYQYRPGEEISGTVHMEVVHNVEIRFVELVIEGQGVITILKPKQDHHSTMKEAYLKKHTFMIGTGDAQWTSLLTPGHYNSTFRFRLPKTLPSSFKHDDLSSGFKLDINYEIKARICSDAGSSSSVRPKGKNLVHVLLSKHEAFRIQRPFDINTITSASSPVTHTEEIYLSCAGNNLVVVTLNLERAVFLAGDDIKLQLAAAMPPSERIKVISCRLRQHLKLDHQHDMTTFVLSNVDRTDPQSSSQTAEETSYEVTIPTQTNLVTSFLQGCSMVRLTYTLSIEMRFAPAGGKLSFTIPLGIGPCAEPIYGEKIASRKVVPIFNRPTRFPCFTPTPAKVPLQVDRNSRSSQSINVVTKYSNSFWAKCFLCCFTAGDVD